MSALNTIYSNSGVSELRTEAQSLAQTRQTYQRFRAYINEASPSALSTFEAIILGATNPINALIYRVCMTVSALCFRGVYSPPMIISLGAERTRIGTTEREIVTPQSIKANYPLIRSLQDNAEKMGLHTLGRGVLGISLDHTEVRTESASFQQDKAIICPSIFFYQPEMICTHFRHTEDPKKAELLQLVQNPAYPVFLGTQVLAHMQMNTKLLLNAIEIVLMFSVMCIFHGLASTFNIQPGNAAFIMIKGLVSLWIANLIGVFCHRFLTYKADRRAVEVTEDRASAVATLRQLQKVEERPSLGILILNFLTFSKTAKRLLSTPSLDSRIQALDPQGKYTSSTGLEIPAEQAVEPSEEQKLKYQIEQHKITLKIPLIIKELFTKRNLGILKDKLLSLIYPAYLQLMTGFSMRNEFWILICSTLFLFALITHLFPYSIERAKSLLPSNYKSSLSSTQINHVRAIGREMGVTKNIEVLEGEFEAKGVAFGPGSALIFIPKNLDIANEEHTACLRHEIAHILSNDSLTGALLYPLMMSTLNRALDQAGYPCSTLIQKFIQGNLINLATFIAVNSFKRYRESMADAHSVDFAPVNQQESQRKALAKHFRNRARNHLRFLEESKTEPVAARLLHHIALTSEGNYRFDLDHPTLTDRAEALEARSMAVTKPQQE